MSHTDCLNPGDGIGPEVAEAACRVIDAANAHIDWLELPAGAGAVDEYGDVLPDTTVQAIEIHRVALKGPITTPIGKGFRSVNVQLRKRLNLYAAASRAQHAGHHDALRNVEIVVIRENTEGLIQDSKTKSRPAWCRASKSPPGPRANASPGSRSITPANAAGAA